MRIPGMKTDKAKRNKAKQEIIKQVQENGLHNLEQFNGRMQKLEILQLVSELRKEGKVEGGWYNKKKLEFLTYDKKRLAKVIANLKKKRQQLQLCAEQLMISEEKIVQKLLEKHNCIVQEEDDQVFHVDYVIDIVNNFVNQSEIRRDDIQRKLIEEGGDFTMLIESLLPKLHEIAQSERINTKVMKKALKKLSPQTKQLTEAIMYKGGEDLLLPEKYSQILLESILPSMLEGKTVLSITDIQKTLHLPHSFVKDGILEIINKGVFREYLYYPTEEKIRRK